mmetsp:Transcript_11476/g.17365  ORF Transcript_11476/g.17365 Transcript_11476/m.17365 type:complete len:210 (-) Transcript_11476:204-833(-)
MFRRSIRRTIEFGEHAKKTYYEPTYGYQKLNRRRWGKGPGHRTVEANRLVSMPLFQKVVKEIDREHLVENGMTIDDIRWLDERILKWNCVRCEHSWRARVSDRTKNGAGCPECAKDIPCVTNSHLRSVPIGSLSSIHKCAKSRFLASVDAASRRIVQLPCTSCGKNFSRSIRCLTGIVCDGQNPVTKQDVCDACLWSAIIMKNAATSSS